MFIDVCFPSGNEKEFVVQAKKLGCSGLIFVYNSLDKKVLETVKGLGSKDFKVFIGSFKNGKGVDYLFSNGSREDFESKKVDVIFDLEQSLKNDKSHYRSSGLNQVLCSLANEKNIFIGLSFGSVLKSPDKCLVLGRMIQNVSLCNKYSVKLLIASFAEKPSELRYWKDLVSFGVVIGLNPKQAKEAVVSCIG
ncbi:MAG: hypothetical protein KKF89_04730 [Nanoarchaeota archaeon]|nr:hypothetical protein [Nanoarchaeota archaeon]MBU1854999.1 hypothetical protein [Nanoarchaeota archaeon]